MALITCDPMSGVSVENVATPPTSVAVPSTVAPSLRVTTPVGLGNDEVTVAVNTTGCPSVDGLGDAVSVVVVAVAEGTAAPSLRGCVDSAPGVTGNATSG